MLHHSPLRGGGLKAQGHHAAITPHQPMFCSCASQQVTIPFGWNLVIDEDPAPILMFDIQGNVNFTNTRNITVKVRRVPM